MNEILATMLEGPNEVEFLNNFKKLLKQLPPHIADKLRKIRIDLGVEHGPGSTFKFMNNKTIGDIIEKYGTTAREQIAAGEIEGTKFVLYGTAAKDGPEK